MTKGGLEHWIDEMPKKHRILTGQQHNIVRQEKKYICRSMKITGKKFKKIEKLNRRLEKENARTKHN